MPCSASCAAGATTADWPRACLKDPLTTLRSPPKPTIPDTVIDQGTDLDLQRAAPAQQLRCELRRCVIGEVKFVAIGRVAAVAGEFHRLYLSATRHRNGDEQGTPTVCGLALQLRLIERPLPGPCHEGRRHLVSRRALSPGQFRREHLDPCRACRGLAASSRAGCYCAGAGSSDVDRSTAARVWGA